ncbi:MAG: hypothetical protein RLZZ385_1521 [Pseudomonadota bacterium]
MSTKALEGNLRRFVGFRLFYSARFYYPVFTILFLDYGLTLEQFALLNIVWALTIVGAEVPSGALADLLGRKRLVVFAAGLMVVEMALLVFVPLGASPLLFTVFLLNRICSGLSEAAASGADEALAYDSLQALGRESEWAALLERCSYVVSIGFFITMISGALAYDQELINGLLTALDPEWRLAPETIIRLPVILTFGNALAAFAITVGMREVHPPSADSVKATWRATLAGPFRQILKAAGWTLSHRFILFVILAALLLDSVARQFVVLASEYYRVIEIPPAWFGVIGAAMSLLGILTARVSRHLVSHYSPWFNFLLLSAVLLCGLLGILLVIPWFGVLFAVMAFVMMGAVSYQSSFYINREVDSGLRATVLSFRGLALNLGLGLASLFYTVLIAGLKAAADADLIGEPLRREVFIDSLKAFPIYFLLLFSGLLWLGTRQVRSNAMVFARPLRHSRSAAEEEQGLVSKLAKEETSGNANERGGERDASG